jgi:hypothetical protein
MHTHQDSSNSVATIGIDIGKNTFRLVGLDKRGAIVLRIKESRSQLERRLVNESDARAKQQGKATSKIAFAPFACMRWRSQAQGIPATLVPDI